MSDLDAEIVALRVSGLSEPEICAQQGCRRTPTSRPA
jgi:hypothetical protein